MKKILKFTAIVLGALIGLAVLAVLALYPVGMEKLTRSYSNITVETVNIPVHADAVARGKHIAVVWGCTKCHGENLGGMLLADDPFLGTIPASNLTRGKGGIAKSYTDADWIRAIRHGVKPNGRAEIFMYDYYSTMIDADLGDLIAYLKQIPPVASDYPAASFGPVIAAAHAVGLLTPAAQIIDHNAPRLPDPAPGVTKDYGSYLAVLCANCHGENLGGKVEKWKQEDFVRALQTGVLPNGETLGGTMSAENFRELNDTELRALWLYLQAMPSEQAQK